ncbi:MAG: LysR family transcriptional regulator [Puniceicoccales bacterium]|jgi:DNA-binding transcriptional LysR family regulator|nr:LysR family transcriptional regulator [Puniceicoccales bacterium]
MHIENFKVFSDLVENQSFSRAAKINGITQSAVSQQLRAMEKHFQVLIVDRSQKRFKLTREGEKLYESTKEIAQHYARIAGKLKEMQKIINGTIHIATIRSIGLYELPPFVKQFLTAHPTVDLRIEYRRSNLVTEDVLNGNVDLGLVAYPEENPRLKVIPFTEDPLVIICTPSHPLATRGTLKATEFAKQHILGFDPDIPTRKATDHAFRTMNIQFPIRMEFDNIETLKHAAEAGLGLALVPASTIRQELAQHTLSSLELEDRRITRPLAIIHRKNSVLSPATKKLVQLMAHQR